MRRRRRTAAKGSAAEASTTCSGTSTRAGDPAGRLLRGSLTARKRRSRPAANAARAASNFSTKRGLAARRQPGAKTRNSGIPKRRKGRRAGPPRSAAGHRRSRRRDAIDEIESPRFLRRRKRGKPDFVDCVDWVDCVDRPKRRGGLPRTAALDEPTKSTTSTNPRRKRTNRLRSFGSSCGAPEFDFPIGIWENRRR